MLLYPIFTPGKILNIFNRRSKISEPTAWGSSSSGYIDINEWYLQTGAVLIRIGWVCDSIWSSSPPSSLSKKLSVILCVYSLLMRTSSSRFTWNRTSLLETLQKLNLLVSKERKTLFYLAPRGAYCFKVSVLLNKTYCDPSFLTFTDSTLPTMMSFESLDW